MFSFYKNKAPVAPDIYIPWDPWFPSGGEYIFHSDFSKLSTKWYMWRKLWLGTLIGARLNALHLAYNRKFAKVLKLENKRPNLCFRRITLSPMWEMTQNWRKLDSRKGVQAAEGEGVLAEALERIKSRSQRPLRNIIGITKQPIECGQMKKKEKWKTAQMFPVWKTEWILRSFTDMLRQLKVVSLNAFFPCRYFKVVFLAPR